MKTSASIAGSCCPTAGVARELMQEDIINKIGAIDDYVIKNAQGDNVLHLMVDGIHCGECIATIERTLKKQEGVTQARVNLSSKRVRIVWTSKKQDAIGYILALAKVGYHAAPYNPDDLNQEEKAQEKMLLRCLAIAGFVTANVMILSVSVWAGNSTGMGYGTRSFLHWISALLTLPAVAYAGQPFFQSALTALRHGRTNMDVPISLAVLLGTGMSLVETMRGAQHVYFDSAITLLFFLLIGRYLEIRARSKALATAENLLALQAIAVTLIDADGTTRVVSPRHVKVGDRVWVAKGMRVPVDGVVIKGASELDNSLISGETVPVVARYGDKVFAGTVNVVSGLEIKVSHVGEGTLLSEIAQLMEDAQQKKALYVGLASRISRGYAPFVHTLALVTFFGWWLFTFVGWQQALLTSISVLIITCPCALGLAVPVVQIIAGSLLMKRGVILKSGEGLERLSQANHFVFDKTGTLTTGKLRLVSQPDGKILEQAASLAKASHHPLSRALSSACPTASLLSGSVEEIAGEGLSCKTLEGEYRLGRRSWVFQMWDNEDIPQDKQESEIPELWFLVPHKAPVRFQFTDSIRSDAHKVISRLKDKGYKVSLLSGDSKAVVKTIANELGFDDWHAQIRPQGKLAFIEELQKNGAKVAMIGDGLNDTAALALAHVSLSPTTAADISQNTADMVFQGERLTPILDAIFIAKKSQKLVIENFALAFFYNIITIPLAALGFVTPLIAAVAMSSSSIIVTLNALRLGWGLKKLKDE